MEEQADGLGVAARASVVVQLGRHGVTHCSFAPADEALSGGRKVGSVGPGTETTCCQPEVGGRGGGGGAGGQFDACTCMHGCRGWLSWRGRGFGGRPAAWRAGWQAFIPSGAMATKSGCWCHAAAGVAAVHRMNGRCGLADVYINRI